LTTYISQGNTATDLRGGGSFNYASSADLSEFKSEKNYGPLLSHKLKVAYFFLRHGVHITDVHVEQAASETQQQPLINYF